MHVPRGLGRQRSPTTSSGGSIGSRSDKAVAEHIERIKRGSGNGSRESRRGRPKLKSPPPSSEDVFLAIAREESSSNPSQKRAPIKKPASEPSRRETRRPSVPEPAAAAVSDGPSRSSVEQRYMQHRARVLARQQLQEQQEQQQRRRVDTRNRSLSGTAAGEISRQKVEERFQARLRSKSSSSSDKTPPASNAGDKLQPLKLRRTSQPVLSTRETSRLYLGRTSSPPPSSPPAKEYDPLDVLRRPRRQAPAATGLGRRALRDAQSDEDGTTGGISGPSTRRISANIDPTAVVLKDGPRSRALRHKSQRTYLSRAYESSPIVKRTSPSPPLPMLPSKRDKTRRRDRQDVRNRSNSSGSSTEESRAWDELDALKSRVRDLERSSRVPSSSLSSAGGAISGANSASGHDGPIATRRHVGRSISGERPLTSESSLHDGAGLGTSAGAIARFDPSATSNKDTSTASSMAHSAMHRHSHRHLTNVTNNHHHLHNNNNTTSTSTTMMLSSSPASGSGANTDIPHLLHRALANVRPQVSKDVFYSLERTIADALSLSSTVNPHQHPPPHQSHPHLLHHHHYQPGHPLSERMLKRKVENVCRGLTEICVALADQPAPPPAAGAGAGGAGPAGGVSTTAPGTMVSTGTGTGMGAAQDMVTLGAGGGEENLTPTSRVLIRAEKRRSSLMALRLGK